MKKLLLPLLIAILASSCATTSKLAELESRMAAAEAANKDLAEAFAWSSGMSVEQALAQKAKAAEPVEIAVDGSWSIGPEDAKVSVVEFSDLECPYSAKVAAVVSDYIQRHGTEVRFIFKHFPLSFHEHSRAAHIALLAAGNQGHFWDYRFEIQKLYDDLSDENILKTAQDLKLDMPRFKADLANDADAVARIDRDVSLGESLDIPGTPTFYVNGLRVEDLSTAIEAALQGQPIQPDDGGGQGCGR